MHLLLLLTHTSWVPSELQILQCCMFQSSQYGHCSVQYSVQSHSNGTVDVQKFVDLPSCVNFPVQKFSNVRKMFCSSESPKVGVYQSVLLQQLLRSPQSPPWVSTSQSSSCSSSGSSSPHSGCLPVSPLPAASLELHGGCLQVSPPPAAPQEPPVPTVGVYQSVLLLQLLRIL
jgi:hypothetical protein